MAVSYKFNGANLDALNARFLECVAQKDVAQAQSFIERGANINVRLNDEDTALLRAIRGDDMPMVTMLLAKKASLDAQGGDGATALILAVKKQNLGLAQSLIDGNADISLEDSDGKKAFDHALRTANPKIVELFEKPMMKILQRIPSSELAQALRASNRDLDGIEPMSGDTMLTFAAGRVDQESVALAFIEAGADLNKKNRAGKTPMQVAQEAGNSAMQKLLEEAQRTPHMGQKKRPAMKPLFPAST